MPAEPETLVAPHETPQTDHTPAPAKALSIGLALWCLFGCVILMGAYVVFRH